MDMGDAVDKETAFAVVVVDVFASAYTLDKTPLPLLATTTEGVNFHPTHRIS